MKKETVENAQKILKEIGVCEDKLNKLVIIEEHDNKCIGFFYGGGATLNFHTAGHSEKVMPELEAIRVAYIATVRSVVERRMDRLHKELEKI